MKRRFYVRVSTQDQTTANQERELREIAGRMGCDVIKVYKDHGISGARFSFAIERAASPRYGTPVLIFWTAALLFISNARQLIKTKTVIGPVVAIILLMPLAWHERDVFAIAHNWRESQLAAKTALLARVLDMDAFRKIYPYPWGVAKAVPALWRERLSPFSEPWAAWKETPLSSHFSVNTNCLGRLDAVEPLLINRGSYRVAGWAWDKAAQMPAEKVVLVDDIGNVVGYAPAGNCARTSTRAWSCTTGL
jgi:hypothetical protein